MPIFLVGTLGASAFSLGLIEGVAEAIASILKLPSGWLSDHWRKRKALALAGYGVAALVKPIFALAPTLGWAFTARSLDHLARAFVARHATRLSRISLLRNCMAPRSVSGRRSILSALLPDR